MNTANKATPFKWLNNIKIIIEKCWQIRHARRIRFFARFFSSFFICLIVSRMIFFLVFKEATADYTNAGLGKAFLIGAQFDMRLAMLMFMPIIPFCIFPVINVQKRKILRFLSKVYTGLVACFVLVIYGVDMGYYAYLQRRIDVTIFNFFSNTDISAEMLWQSYPILWILLGLIAAIWGITKLLKWQHAPLENATYRYSWYQKTLGIMIGGLIFIFGCWQNFGQYPLRWSEAFFSQHYFSNALALNPCLFFYDTYTFLEKEYDVEKTQKYYPQVAQYLGVKDARPFDFTRTKTHNRTDKSPNIIVVLLETVPVNRFGLVGNPLDVTPFMDQLGTEGLFFEQCYVPVYGTARAIFGLFAGIPDVSRADTSSRNPLITKQNSIVSAFKDYEKYFFIGGSASWANIRGFITHNIPDIQMFEQDSFKAKRVDVWGVSDYDLLMESLERLKKRRSKKPFFAFIQTAANHSPYTIPKHIKGFKKDDSVTDKQLEEAGFKSKDQYEAMRLLDFSVSEFMKEVKKSGLDKETIFCFFGDHGTIGPPPKHMSAMSNALGLDNFHIPWILYAPNYLKRTGAIKGVTNLHDMLPTVAGLAGISYENKTFGKDVLAQTDEEREQNKTLIVTFRESKSKIGLIGKDFYLTLYRDGTHDRLYKTNAEDVKKVIDVKAKYPKVLKEYHSLGLGLYETAKYMLHHP